MIVLSISQNFLKDSDLVKCLLFKTNINAKDTIVEIGPGKGIITTELSKVCNKVVAIEYDNTLYSLLLKNNYSNVELINMDFLEYEFKSNVKLFANIPFNITSNIFNKILDNYKYIEDFYFIMQKEAALMYMGDPYESLKSVLLKPIYSGEIIHNFEKTDFVPSPNVDTVLVHFHKNDYCDIKRATVEEYFDFMANIFNNTKTTIKDKISNVITSEQLKRIKKLLKCDFNSKITDLCYQDFLVLFNTYRDYVPQNKKDSIKGSYHKLKSEQDNLSKINRTRQ